MSSPTATGGHPAARPARVQALCLVVLTIAVLFARRPAQFLHPYIWVEDGTVILKAYAERGLASVLEPVNGYQILATKLISLSAFQLSIEWAPEIALVLTVAYTCAIVAAVAFSPTHLRWPFLCAIAVLTLPIDSEVFAVSELAFWWAGLLLILALVWDTDRGRSWLRALYVVLGGLSSPLAVPIAGLFITRALLERRRDEFVIAAIALAVAAIQAREIFGTQHLDYSRLIDPHIIRVALDKFAGYIFASPRYGNYYSGTILLALTGVAIWRIRNRLTLHFWLLVLVWGAIVAMIVLRNELSILDTLWGGPRYFFHPFTTMMWILIWIAALSPVHVRILLVALYLIGIAWVYKRMTRSHDALDWRGHITACTQSPEYALPIHYDGRYNGNNPIEMWHVWLTGQQCRDLIARSLIRRW
jgi:hypothetical protein